MNEFDIIDHYFSQLTNTRPDVETSIGDDCALLKPEAGTLLAVSTDTLVAGRHFFADADPEKLGHKCLAVNLSDLAAMGAKPAWVTLALTLPMADENWLNEFSKGFARLAAQHHVQLVGGDTTRGDLCITITVFGQVDPGRVMKRSGARAGDLVCVSGHLGSAALALINRQAGKQTDQELENALDMPRPRIELGLALAGIATACIDLSDGLIGDLGHICKASGAGATVYLNKLPCHALVLQYVQDQNGWDPVVAGGDDYELCFTIPPEKAMLLEQIAGQLGVELTVIGEITSAESVTFCNEKNEIVEIFKAGFRHFE